MEKESETILILVSGLWPGTEREFKESAMLVRENYPNISQCQITTVDTNQEASALRVIKDLWDLPEPREQISINNTFLGKTLQLDPKKFAKGVESYLKARSMSMTPQVIVAPKSVLSSILDLTGLHEIKDLLRRNNIVVLEKIEGRYSKSFAS
jgi:hypothetical protein